jgi:hypothetical protein
MSIDPRIKKMTPEQLLRFLNTSDIRGQYGGQFGFEADWGDLHRQAIEQLKSGASPAAPTPAAPTPATPTPAAPPQSDVVTTMPVTAGDIPQYGGPTSLSPEFRLAAPNYGNLTETLKNKQKLEEMGVLDRFGAQQAAEQAQQQAALATRGGLRSGSAERLARAGSLSSLLGKQDVRAKGALARSGIEADLGAKQLGDQYSADQFNIQTGIGEGQRSFENKYKTWAKLKEIEAAKTMADATRSGMTPPGQRMGQPGWNPLGLPSFQGSSFIPGYDLMKNPTDPVNLIPGGGQLREVGRSIGFNF